MVNLKDLLEIRNMQYRETPKEKHAKRMTMETPNFTDVMIPHNPPFENDSRETLGELKYLQTLETDKDFVKKHDDVIKVFVELLKEFEVHTLQREEVIRGRFEKVITDLNSDKDQLVQGLETRLKDVETKIDRFEAQIRKLFSIVSKTQELLKAKAQ